MMRNTETREANRPQQPKNARELYAEHYMSEFDTYLKKRNSAFWLRDSFARVGAFFVRAGAFFLKCLSWGYFNYRYKTEKEKVTEYIVKKIKPALIRYAKREGTTKEIEDRRKDLITQLDEGLSRFPRQAKEDSKKNEPTHKNYLHYLLLGAKKAIPNLLDIAYDVFTLISPYLTESDVASVSQVSAPARVVFNEEILLRKLLKYIVTDKQKEAEDMLKKADPSLRLRLLRRRSIVTGKSGPHNFTALQCALFFLGGAKKIAMEQMILKYLPQASAELQRKELDDRRNALKEELRVAKEELRAATEENRILKATLRDMLERNRSPVSITVGSIFSRETSLPQASSLAGPAQTPEPPTVSY